ncbi:MAG: right-handed parallel beta-helix repeat-containing protein, partial [Chloroflexales bacterium]
PFQPTLPPFQPTNPPDAPKEPLPTPTDAPVLPTTPPVDVLEGNVRWSVGQSPIIVRRDLQLAPGAELIIEPGVEVRLDPGVSLYVDGARLLALGLPGQHVRFVGSSRARWSGIFGRPNSFVVMENTEVRGGGAGGTVMAVDGSELVVRSSWISDNGGGILITDTKIELRDTEISGNDVPFGSAFDASYARGTMVTLQSNRIGGNRLSDGAPMVRVANQSTFNSLVLDISGNLIRGGTPNLQMITNGPLQGSVVCNALVGDGPGFGLRTQTVQVNPNGVPPLSLALANNFVDEHISPVIPTYLKYGLGRGATSEVLIDMRNNWWGDASGPYEPNANPQGRGDSVGSNILFSPWLTQPPACAPNK